LVLLPLYECGGAIDALLTPESSERYKFRPLAVKAAMD
jgi:hypothetical protein